MLVLDFPYPGRIEEFRERRYDYGVIEQYFEASSGIVHLNRHEQDDLLTGVGFKEIERTDIGQGMFDLILAVR